MFAASPFYLRRSTVDNVRGVGACLSPQYPFCQPEEFQGCDSSPSSYVLKAPPLCPPFPSSTISIFGSVLSRLGVGGAAAVSPAGLVDPEAVLSHIKEISDDRYEGRDSPSKGLDLAAAYISGVAAKNGLVGANDSNSENKFLQPFSIYGFSPLKLFRSQFKPRHDGYMPDIYGPTLFEFAVHEDELEVRQRQSAATSIQFFAWGKSSNVVGVLEGSDPKLKDEFVMVSAHYDHVGTRRSGKDRIYNGADDNASGAAVLMGILPALAKMKEEGRGPKRSVIFVWTAAEEKGLLGADYYRKNPLKPLSKTKAAINVDMVARLSADEISVCDIDARGNPNFFRQLVEGAALAAGFSEVNRDIDAYFDRQDGGVWVEAGIPTVFLFEGFTSDGKLNPDYHGVGDDYDAIIKDNGGEKVVRAARMTLELVIKAAGR